MRDLKNFHDSATHMAVMENDPQRLRDLLDKGLSVQHKSVDGATPLHRAAETGSQACAEVLLEYNADLDANNYSGQTPFHVAGVNRNVEFGHFLRSHGASTSCREGCTKCRWLNQMIYRRMQKLRM